MIDETQNKNDILNNQNFYFSIDNLNPEIAIRKEKIFSKTDYSKRKTKIICTLG